MALPSTTECLLKFGISVDQVVFEHPAVVTTYVVEKWSAFPALAYSSPLLLLAGEE